MKQFWTLFLFLISIGFLNDLFPHADNTHKYIVTKAYEVLRNTLGVDIPAIQAHLGGTDSYYDGEYPFQRRFITTGAYREDQEDLIFNYDGFLLSGLGLDFDNWVVSITHFWDADNGDYTNNQITATHALGHTLLGSFPNAYVKLTQYCNPNRGWEFKFKLLPGEAQFQLSNGSYIYIPHCGGVGFKYNSLIELYKTGRAYVVGYYQCPNSNWEQCYYEVILGQGWRDAIVWELLGRMCHLVADMSVPAHAHADEHGYVSDAYEDWMGNWGNPAVFLTDAELSSLTILNPYQGSDPLHFLMYTLQQVTDHFYSNGNDFNGDGDNNLGGNGRPEEINWINNNYDLPNLGSPQTIAEARTGVGRYNLRNVTYLLAIRATAGLLYWFATETGLIPNNIVLQNITVQNNETKNYFAGNTLSAGTNGYSFLINPGAHVDFYAGNRITLGPGFRAQNGSYFRAHLVGGSGSIANNNSLATPLNSLSKLDNLNKSSESLTGFPIEEIKKIPTEFLLDQNYPNPFNPLTRISYALPNESQVTLKVYDILGKEVAELVNQHQDAGYYNVDFDGSKLSSGIYIYLLKAGSFTSAKKFILMK